MTAEPITAFKDMSADAAIVLMKQFHIHRLPVVDGETVVGMVQREQLDAALVPSVGLGL